MNRTDDNVIVNVVSWLLRYARFMATIKDVAIAAGVSLKTVSRVINDEPGVAIETRQQVQAVIHRLGYVPNISAQRLKSGRARTFTLVLPRVESPYASKLLSHVLAEARRRGYSVLVLEADANHQAGRELIERGINRRLSDGLLIAPPGGDSLDLLNTLQESAMPYVVITPHHIDKVPLSVDVTDRAGSEELVRYLISLGHQRIAHVGAGSQRFAQERLAGYVQAFAAAGLPVDHALIRHGDTQVESGRLVAMNLLTLPDRPSAFFAANDEMAIGIMMAAWHLGLKVPDDVSVAGFDDVPIAQQVYPPLTTVCQPIDQMVQAAIDMLINAINARSPENIHLQVPTRLVIRHSCASPH